MASAILPSRYDSRSSDFMSQFTVNSNLNFTRLRNIPKPNPNPNPNLNSSHFVIDKTSRDVLRGNHQQLSRSTPPEAAFVSSSLNSVPPKPYGYRYITFRLSSYTRRELKLLRKRLISDLERVRNLRQFACSTPIPKTNYHAPQLVNDRERSVIGQKRTKPLPAVRDTKKQCGRLTNVQKRKLMMRECGQILGKLMKNKHGWVFNKPVDVAGLKLFDYHSVITNPMDLGTIKSKLAKNEYKSPLAFASDVRLTFENAMLYNGKGSNVFVMAERLLLLFEGMFNSIHQKFVANQSKKQNPPASVPILFETPSAPQRTDTNLGNKPAMTADQKSDLASRLWDLQQLAPEEVDQIKGIVKKSLGLAVAETGNEIELDLAVLDNETLWELQSFINGTLRKEAAAAAATPNMKGEAGEEDVDVDIGEEMELTNYPLVEIEKDAVNVSSSSVSSSDSSSSSDSGSSKLNTNES